MTRRRRRLSRLARRPPSRLPSRLSSASTRSLVSMESGKCTSLSKWSCRTTPASPRWSPRRKRRRCVLQLASLSNRCPPSLQVRRKALPPEFWDARRRALNHNRLQRNYSRRKRRGEALRQEESERRAAMDEQQQAEHQAQKDAERAAAKAAAAAQRERVAEAMGHGLRVVVDCSLSGTASDREVRSLAKQLELCAAANKRACRPVSLQFASFTGAVKRFALEGMHADRWPAARSHEAPLQQLFAAQELVVLSPDAQKPLLSLDATKASEGALLFFWAALVSWVLARRQVALIAALLAHATSLSQGWPDADRQFHSVVSYLSGSRGASAACWVACRCTSLAVLLTAQCRRVRA